MKHFTDAYGKINGLFHKIFESLTPEQKQKILKTLTAKEGDKDFINTLGAAVNEAVKYRPVLLIPFQGIWFSLQIINIFF